MSFLLLLLTVALAVCVVAHEHHHIDERSDLVAASHDISAVTGVTWNVTANPSGVGYLVQFGAASKFAANSYVAFGLSATPGMHQSFILSCTKSANGQLTLQQRYADEHTKPPIFDWGAQHAQSASGGNMCSAVIPKMLTNTGDPDNVPVTIGKTSPVYVIIAAGELDASGDIKYHGVMKDDTRTLLVG